MALIREDDQLYDHIKVSSINGKPLTTLDIGVFIRSFVIPTHDYVGMTYTNDNLTTLIYKNGGASGSTAATLTLAYNSGGNLLSITKT